MIPHLVFTGSDLAAIGGAFLVLLGVVATAVFGFRSNANSSAVAIAGTLASRLAAVEQKLTEVEKQLSMSQKAIIAAVRFIDRLVEWGRAGGKGRMPTPPHDLHDYLDPDMWGTAEVAPPRSPEGR